MKFTSHNIKPVSVLHLSLCAVYMQKKKHTQWYSIPIISCKTLCYYMVTLQCMIKNDSFQENTC